MVHAIHRTGRWARDRSKETATGRAALRLVGVTVLAIFWSARNGRAQPAAPPLVLVVTDSAGDHDGVLRARGDRPPVVVEVLRHLSRASGDFRILWAQFGAKAFTGEGLAGVRAVVLFRGEPPSVDGEAPARLTAWVEAGGALVAIHSTTRARDENSALPRALGAVQTGRRWHGELGVTIHDKRHPATLPLRPYLKIHDQIGLNRSFDPERSRLLMSLDPGSVPPGERPGGHVPVAWIHPHGKGRVFYTALGHAEATWRDTRFQQHLLGGLRWALGLVSADATPDPRHARAMAELARSLRPGRSPR